MPPKASREKVVRQVEGEPIEFIPPVPVRLLTAQPQDEQIAELWSR